jgi:hypothetical protein
MPLPVENIAAQRQPQDLRYADMGHYGMAHGGPPLHERHDHAIYDGVALDVPAQAPAAPLAPVCIDLTFHITYLTRPLSGKD